MPRPRPAEPTLRLARGIWCIHWYDGTERRRLSTGTANPVRAQQALADFLAALEASPLQLSLRDALDAYVLDRTNKVEDLGRLKNAADALSVSLGNYRVDQITQARWDYYAAQRVTRPRPNQVEHVPRPVSTGTLRREFNVLRAALRHAWKSGHLARQPTLEGPPDSAPRDRFLTKDEARRVIAACVSPHVRVFCAIGLMTGARKTAILRLTWDRVSLERQRIDFGEPGRRITGKKRSIVPIISTLLPILREAHAMRTCEHVIEFNGRPVPFGLRWSFAKACKRAGLDWLPTPHHTKHSVASWFAMERVPIDQAADWLNTDAKTLKRVYRKFDPDYLRAVGGALEL